jgi:Tol biopolymer transport system component
MRPTGLTIAKVLFGALLMGTGVAAMQQVRPEVALRAAIELETIRGDTKGAIDAYKQLAQSDNAAVAATSLWRLAELYRRLGDPQSRVVYERLARDFSGRPEAALAAKVLASLAVARQSTTMTTQRIDVNSATSVSPDGRYVSVYDENTTALVRVHELATGRSRLLAGRSSASHPPGRADWGVFSRDSRQIAYTRRNESEKRSELWAADIADDANPRPLFANQDRAFAHIRPADWSPDGTTIAALVNRSGVYSVALFSLRDQTLQVLPATETDAQGAVSFSPDGRYLGFTREIERGGTRQRDVSIVASDGSTQIEVAPHPARDDFAGWSPDGKMLLFMSTRTGSQTLFGLTFAEGHVQGEPVAIRTGLEALRVFGITPAGDLHFISRSAGAQSSDVKIAAFDFANGRWASEPVTVSGIGTHSGPQWSPTGAHLAHITSNGPTQSLSIRSTATGQTYELGMKAGMALGSYRWSLDGRSIAVVLNGVGGGLFRVDAASHEMSLIEPATGSQQLEVHRWSRDGRTLFYYRVMNGEAPSVTLVARNLASGRDVELLRLADNPNTELIELSADETKMFFRRSLPASTGQVNSGVRVEGGGYAFIERDLASGAEREVARRPAMGHPNASPDGRLLATASRDRSSGTHSLLVIPVSGGEPRELAQVKAPDAINVATWAPDSRSLFAVITRANQATELIWVPIDGRQLKTVPSVGTSPFSVNIRPSGSEIAYTFTPPARPRVELWVLKNFLPAVRER